MKVFITGGTTGIGFALARLYLDLGHIVGVCGRNLDKIPDGFTHDHLKTYQVDVTNREEVLHAIKDFGKDGLDLVLANAAPIYLY